MLHMNELPLRKLFIEIDGCSSGPDRFTGPIGKLITKEYNLPIVNFQIIEIDDNFKSNLTNLENIGSDQKYLRDIILGISSGEVSDSLANRSPGKLGYARWLTHANRILRSFVSISEPTEDMLNIVKYSINVYARTWFLIRSKPSFTNGSRHIFNMIAFIKEQNFKYEYNNILFKVINRNSYYAHSENILISMLTDDNPNIRLLAVNKIVLCRQRPEILTPRKFTVPNINVDATEYHLMIDEDGWYESVMTENIPTSTLLTYTIDNIPIFKFPLYPCHSQSVERHIRLVSETSKMIADADLRDGRIAATLLARKIMPSFNTKNQYR